MISLPTLRQLRYLQALHEHGHFGRAAEACHVTQSTLSAGLAELEDLLGAQLVERTKRRVLFTPLGNEGARPGPGLFPDAGAGSALQKGISASAALSARGADGPAARRITGGPARRRSSRPALPDPGG